MIGIRENKYVQQTIGFGSTIIYSKSPSISLVEIEIDEIIVGILILWKGRL